MASVRLSIVTKSGVAVGQTITGTASPLTTLRANDGRLSRGASKTLRGLLSDYQPAHLVVGKPLNMDGTRLAMTRHAETFADTLAKLADRPVHMTDERLTTYATGAARDSHDQAAVLIAEQWLREQAQ